jgi:hypothetical protein
VKLKVRATKAGEVEKFASPLYVVKPCLVGIKVMTVFSTLINIDGILGFFVSTGLPYCLSGLREH